MDSNELAIGIAWYVVFVFSTTAHEAAHAWVAMRGGDLTAYEGGQVSLDPTPHIRRSPIGMVVVPILSFVLGGYMMGWASAPYDPVWARANPHRAARMALAGPIANLALTVLAGISIRAGIAMGVFEFPSRLSFTHLVDGPGEGIIPALALFASLMFSMNLLLFILNMVPLPPLDGSSAIGLLMSEERANRVQDFMEQPMLAMFGIMGAFILIGRIFGPMFFAAVGWLYPEFVA